MRVADQTNFRAVVSYVVGRLKTELQPYVSMFPFLIVGGQAFQNIGCECVKYLPLQISDHLESEGKMVELKLKQQKKNKKRGGAGRMGRRTPRERSRREARRGGGGCRVRRECRLIYFGGGARSGRRRRRRKRAATTEEGW